MVNRGGTAPATKERENFMPKMSQKKYANLLHEKSRLRDFLDNDTSVRLLLHDMLYWEHDGRDYLASSLRFKNHVPFFRVSRLSASGKSLVLAEVDADAETTMGEVYRSLR